MPGMLDFSTWSPETQQRVLALARARCFIVTKPGYIRFRRPDLLPNQQQDSAAYPVVRPRDIVGIDEGTVIYVPKYASDFTDHPQAMISIEVAILTHVRMSMLSKGIPLFALRDAVVKEIEAGKQEEADILRLLGR
jgi:hypothetical protein